MSTIQRREIEALRATCIDTIEALREERESDTRSPESRLIDEGKIMAYGRVLNQIDLILYPGPTRLLDILTDTGEGDDLPIF